MSCAVCPSEITPLGKVNGGTAREEFNNTVVSMLSVQDEYHAEVARHREREMLAQATAASLACSDATVVYDDEFACNGEEKQEAGALPWLPSVPAGIPVAHGFFSTGSASPTSATVAAGNASAPIPPPRATVASTSPSTSSYVVIPAGDPVCGDTCAAAPGLPCEACSRTGYVVLDGKLVDESHLRQYSTAGHREPLVEDVMLPSSVLGSVSDYLELGRSHKCYWDSLETMAHVLKTVAASMQRCGVKAV